MSIVQLTDDQVVELVKQLPPERKRAALYALAETAEGREKRMAAGEQGLRRAALARGMNWDTMDEAARESFIDDLAHEDRA